MVKRKQADDDNTAAEPFAKGLKTDGGRLGLSAAATSGGSSNGNNPSQLSHSATATKGVSLIYYCTRINAYIITCLTLLLNDI